MGEVRSGRTALDLKMRYGPKGAQINLGQNPPRSTGVCNFALEATWLSPRCRPWFMPVAHETVLKAAHSGFGMSFEPSSRE